MGWCVKSKGFWHSAHRLFDKVKIIFHILCLRISDFKTKKLFKLGSSNKMACVKYNFRFWRQNKLEASPSDRCCWLNDFQCGIYTVANCNWCSIMTNQLYDCILYKCLMSKQIHAIQMFVFDYLPLAPFFGCSISFSTIACSSVDVTSRALFVKCLYRWYNKTHQQWTKGYMKGIHKVTWIKS